MGSFLWLQELLPTIFEFPYSRYITSNFFRRFYPIFSWYYYGAPDVSTYFYIYTAAPHNTHAFLYFFQKSNFENFLSPFPGPQGLLPTILEFPYSRYITSNFSDVSTPFFHGFTPALPTFRLTFTSIRRHLTTHTFLYFFLKSNFQILGGPFPGPQGILPTIFEFPYSRYMTSNLFRRFYPIFDQLSYIF